MENPYREYLDELQAKMYEIEDKLEELRADQMDAESYEESEGIDLLIDDLEREYEALKTEYEDFKYAGNEMNILNGVSYWD